MPRRGDDVRIRLRDAALELFRERGYDRTTAAEIAARARVTERTFFRHFPDKREVLFESGAVLQAALVASIADAPAGLAPLEVLFRAFRAFVPALEANRPYAEPRQRVIAANPALQERELTKLATLTAALAAALRVRGVAPLRAELAAHAGLGAFTQATIAWLNDSRVDLGEQMDLAARELRVVLAEND